MIELKHGIYGASLGAMFLTLTACAGGSDNSHSSEEKTGPEPLSIARTASLGVSCSGCHNETGGTLAPLTGRDAETLISQLTTYREQEDGTSVMHRLARGYTDEEITAIATYLTNGEAD